MRQQSRARPLGAHPIRIPRRDQHQFADIFKQNSLKNSLLPIVVPRDVHAELFANPNAPVKMDLASQTLTSPPAAPVEFPVDPFAKHCLLEGIDELGYILQQSPAITAFESTR